MSEGCYHQFGICNCPKSVVLTAKVDVVLDGEYVVVTIHLDGKALAKQVLGKG